ncbi:TPA: hypothetical protein ACJ51R_001650 [Streptococcus suis]
MKKMILTLLLCGAFLAACSNKPTDGATPSVPAESSENIAETSAENGTQTETDTETETYKLVPYNEVHEFKNAKASKGVLDDEGIYRYDFLNEDDAVYDMMSYEEVEDIYPVQEQEKIEVTLGTNFTIDDYNFNLDGLTPNILYKNVLREEKESMFKDMLENGGSSAGSIRLPSQIGETSKPISINYTMLNTQKREVNKNDARIKDISVEHYGKIISGTKENLGARVAYEGINLFITRTQFIENVKINNPIFHDENFYYGKEFNKEYKNVSISYFLDAGKDGDIDTDFDNSFVTFKFEDEILTSIALNCKESYLNLEVE